MADLCGEPVPETIEEKKKMLLAHHIAVWDVIQSCDIKGSSDSSIRNVERRIFEGFWRNHRSRGSMPTVTKQESFIENISCP